MMIESSLDFIFSKLFLVSYMCQLDQDKWNYQYQSNAAQAQQLDPRLHSAPKILYVMDSTRRL